tara:strand:+ start:1888 stop:2259 length:372 start_codon:yes stop_codon:yes gene_type:complete
MRVKLSYTVDDADVLAEAANLIGLSSNEVQRVVNYFAQIQNELVIDRESGRHQINIERVLTLMEKYRNALLNIDTRAAEVSEIIVGYRDYHLTAPAGERPTLEGAVPPEPPPLDVAPTGHEGK